MTSRDTFIASVKTANTKSSDKATVAVATKSSAITAATCDVGYTTQAGTYATLASSVAAANKAFLDNQFAALQAKQAQFDVARDALRGAGDYGPA